MAQKGDQTLAPANRSKFARQLLLPLLPGQRAVGRGYRLGEKSGTRNAHPPGTVVRSAVFHGKAGSHFISVAYRT